MKPCPCFFGCLLVRIPTFNLISRLRNIYPDIGRILEGGDLVRGRQRGASPAVRAIETGDRHPEVGRQGAGAQE